MRFCGSAGSQAGSTHSRKTYLMTSDGQRPSPRYYTVAGVPSDLEQQQSPRYYTVAGVPSDLEQQQSPRYHTVAGVPSDLEQQESRRKYYTVAGNPLQHAQSSLIPSSTTNDHPNPYFGHSSTVGHDAYRIPAQQQNAASASSKCLPTGELHVGIYRAKDIKGDEFYSWGKADPYVKVKFDTHEKKTRADSDAGSDPEWDQMFRFIVRESNHKYNGLSIIILNKNLSRKDDILGQLTIMNLGQILSENNNNIFAKWFPVFVNKKEKGKILLAFHFYPRSPADILKCPAVHVSAAPAIQIPQSNYECKINADVIQIFLQGVGIVVASTLAALAL